MHTNICGFLLLISIASCHTVELNDVICFRANEKICFNALENICLLKAATSTLQNAQHHCVLNGIIEKVRVFVCFFDTELSDKLADLCDWDTQKQELAG